MCALRMQIQHVVIIFFADFPFANDNHSYSLTLKLVLKTLWANMFLE